MSDRLPTLLKHRRRWGVLDPELAWVTAAIDDDGAWSELLRSWLWEIAADSMHSAE